MDGSNRTKLHDEQPMPFGKYKGQRLGDVPDSYWRWFLRQDWSGRDPDLHDLLEYALLVEED